MHFVLLKSFEEVSVRSFFVRCLQLHDVAVCEDPGLKR